MQASIPTIDLSFGISSPSRILALALLFMAYPSRSSDHSLIGLREYRTPGSSAKIATT